MLFQATQFVGLWDAALENQYLSNQGKEKGQLEAKGKKEELLCWVGSLMPLVVIFYWNDLERFHCYLEKKIHEGTPFVHLIKM